jgi:hypothetical protein
LLTIFAFAIAIAFGIWASRAIAFGFLVSMVALIITGFVFAFLSRPFANRPAAAYATFRGLTNVVIAHNHAALSSRFDTWNPEDVWSGLRVILVEQLNVKPEAVKREARLIEDLGMN